MQIKVSNFGPISTANIDLRPLTVFVGPSNTGKSYLAILVYALHRFFSGAAFDLDSKMPVLGSRPNSFPFNPFYDSESTDNAESTGREAEVLAHWIKQVSQRDKSSSDRQELPGPIADLVRPQLLPTTMWDEVLPQELARCFGTTDPHWLVRHGQESNAQFSLMQLDSEGRQPAFPLEYEFELTRRGFKSTGSISEGTSLEVEGSSLRKLERQARYLTEFENEYELQHYQHYASLLRWFLKRELAGLVGSPMMRPLCQRGHYLPVDRTGVMHAHKVIVASMISNAPYATLGTNEATPSLSGILSDFLIQILSLGSQGETRRKGNLDGFGTNIEECMLGGTVQTDLPENGYPAFSYIPEGWNDKLPLLTASSMVSELAPVVLYLRQVVRPGDVLIIEEPESNLHPGMQVELVRQLAIAVNAGVRIMLTTHSEWILEELANLVRLSDLTQEKRRGELAVAPALDQRDVGVWLFNKQKVQEGSTVSEIPLDLEAGGFASEYDTVARSTYNRWARIQSLIEP